MSAFGIEVPGGCVRVFEPGVSKHDALDALIDALSQEEAVGDGEALRKALFEREAIQSTGIGGGVAIPHVRLNEVSTPVLGVGVSESGIDFDSLDQGPVHVIVLFAMPGGSQKTYLNLLAQVMVTLKTPGFRERLTRCRSSREVTDVLRASDAGGAPDA